MNHVPDRRPPLLVVCALALAACGSSVAQGVADGPLAPTANVGTVTTTVDAAIGVPAGATLTSVAASDADVLVAGADADGPAVWSATADGGWSRAALPGAKRALPDAVAVDGPDGVAFAGARSARSALWNRDADGRWERVPRAAAGIDGRVTAVTRDGDRWIAVGDRVDAEAGEAYEGAVWISDDGRTFSPLAADLRLAEGTVADVAAADGTVVVVGFDVTGGQVWVAAGDDRFTPATGAFGAAELQGVAATPDGFVAVGRALGDLSPRVWTSDDGATWTEVDVASTAVEPDDSIDDAATVGDLVFVVGGSPTGGVLWTLADGRLTRLD